MDAHPNSASLAGHADDEAGLLLGLQPCCCIKRVMVAVVGVAVVVVVVL